MTLFEYLAIAYSLVLSFAVIRTVSGLPHALDSERRYWVHTVWIFSTLGTLLLAFWNFWYFRDISWTLGKFAMVLSNPAVLFVFTAYLLPDQPANIHSWQDYFYSVRSKLFAIGIAWICCLLAISTIILDFPLNSPVHIYHYTLLSLFILGWLSSNARIHAAISVVPLGVIILFLVFSFSQPESPSKLRERLADRERLAPIAKRLTKPGASQAEYADKNSTSTNDRAKGDTR